MISGESLLIWVSCNLSSGAIVGSARDRKCVMIEDEYHNNWLCRSTTFDYSEITTNLGLSGNYTNNNIEKFFLLDYEVFHLLQWHLN